MADPKKPIDPQKEIEILIGELEERVDRLRAIYEQYFMGYEKLEPTVPRKDVDRRFVVLRKANIRNTALRFRFNVITQKFNTYAMYWTRICRQIEEGTFKRHIQKAKSRFGNPNARRPEDFSVDIDLDDFDVDMADFDSEGDDLDNALDGALAEAAAAVPSEPPPPKKRAPLQAPVQSPVVSASFGSIDDDLGLDSTPPPSVPGQRHARPAVLPAGLKQRVLVKKGAAAGPSGPGSTPTPGPQQAPVRGPMPSAPEQTPAPAAARARMPSVSDHVPASVPRQHVSPQVRPRMPSISDEQAPPSARPQIRPRMPSVSDEQPSSAGAQQAAPQVRPRMPSVPDGAPSTSVIRASQAQGQGHVHRSPAGVMRPQISPAGSTGRMAAAKPSGEGPGAASVQRVPAAQPSAGAASVQRVPAAQPSAGARPAQPSSPGAGSVQRVPAAGPNPALGRQPSPATTPAAIPESAQRIPAAPRVPVGLPSGNAPGSVARVPVAPGSEPKAPGPPPPSDRKLPAAPARPGGPMPAAAPVRPQSSPDLGGMASRRPPPPLPSQIKKP